VTDGNAIILCLDSQWTQNLALTNNKTGYSLEYFTISMDNHPSSSCLKNHSRLYPVLLFVRARFWVHWLSKHNIIAFPSVTHLSVSLSVSDSFYMGSNKKNREPIKKIWKQ
jgi:hypothetical protein